jgi:hypothetical protein
MARASAKGKVKGVKIKAPAPPVKPLKQAKKAGKTRAPAGQNKAAIAAAEFLAELKKDVPDITSESFALSYNLPLDEVGRMKAFVVQYLKDYNHVAAALRMGYPEIAAPDAGRLMLSNPYVQLRIDELMRRAEYTSIVSGGQIVAALVQEANKPDKVLSGCAMSNSSTRISALKELAKIMGLLIPKPPEAQKIVRYVMYIPAPFDWERGARESQKALKASVVVDV